MAQPADGRHQGRHRAPRRRRTGPAVALAVLAVVAVSVAAYLFRGGSAPVAGPSSTPHPSQITTSPVRAARVSGSRPAISAAPTHRAVLTPQGMWWGVDSSGPISTGSLRNVAGWYRGARPQFWGRYLLGSYAVSRHELAVARAHHVYVYLIVNDQNCSGCAGGDTCGNDQTTEQARLDARTAARQADRLGIPAGAVLFKDIEQVSSCRGEPTSDYLRGWYRTLRHTRYRTGFYGNTFRPFYEFPVAYCQAVRASADFAADVVLDMNQPEPRLGAPQGNTGPHNAPKFRPSEPPCTPRGKTVIWQYGESVDPANLTDIDQARPGTPGFLAPDGAVT